MKWQMTDDPDAPLTGDVAITLPLGTARNYDPLPVNDRLLCSELPEPPSPIYERARLASAVLILALSGCASYGRVVRFYNPPDTFQPPPSVAHCGQPIWRGLHENNRYTYRFDCPTEIVLVDEETKRIVKRDPL